MGRSIVRALVLLTCLLAPLRAEAQIALDAYTTSNNLVLSASSQSFSFTCSGSNLLLEVTVQYSTSGGGTVSSVTFNGVGASFVAGIDFPVTGSPGNRLEKWALLGPSTGTHTLTVTLSDSSTYIATNAISLTGVSQTSQPEATHTATSSSTTSLSNSVTTLTNNAWVLISAGGGTTTPTAGTNVTATSTDSPLAGYYGPQSPAGSVTMTVTSSPAQELVSIVAVYAPAGGTSTPSCNSGLLLLGVGCGH